MRHLIYVVVCAVFLTTLHVQAAPTFPDLTGRVVDQADLLSHQEEAQLTNLSQKLEDETTNQLVIVTLQSLNGYDIADYGYQLGRHWGIGQKDKDNGVLIIVAPNERKVRIEVGYGLEGDLTDATSKTIIDQIMVPDFKNGNYAQGILKATKTIASLLSTNPDEKAAAQKTLKKKSNKLIDVGLILFIIFLWILLRRAQPTKVGVLPLFFLGGGGFGSGGGGFSGGGGSFGGGGASGGW